MHSWSHEVSNHGDMVKILVGNKADLEEQRVVSEEMAINFALLQNIDLAVECSAKVNDNIDYLFHTAAKKLLEKYSKIANDRQKKNDNLELLQYNGISKSMEKIFLSPRKLKTHVLTANVSIQQQNRNIFQRLCIIL